MRQDFGYLKVRRLVVLFGGMLATTPALAQQVVPSGLQVVAGQASLHQNGGQLTVTNSNNAILNWNSFSIGAANSVRFAQPGSSSQVLNRVVGNDPSSILGSLSSNGRVWLLNPNGVLFGANSRVDVAGLVTSTLNLANSDWLAGRYLFTGGTTAAAIDNQGQLRTTLGGQVALIGGSVSNEGIIEASGGQITLAAGQSVELVDTGAPNLAVKVTAPGGSALNLGSLSAGRIDVMAAAVNQQGLVQAETLSAGPAGEIVLQAGERLTLAGGSATRADGAVGGAIKLLGSEIDVQNGSVVSASGAGGGGSILVGGGAEGKDTSVPNAQAVYVAPQASLSADALSQGDGGHIVVWSDVATRAFGRYSAHAGTEGGNGGLIETSGHWLDARPAALDVSAPKGSAGTWLLDPFNITISDSVSDSGTNAAFTATADDATIHTDTIVNALNAGTNVTISTGNGGSQAGTISIASATLGSPSLPLHPSNSVNLSFIANSDINVTDSNLFNSGVGPLSILLKAGTGGTGSISMTGASSITTSGDITFSAQNDINIASSSISAAEIGPVSVSLKAGAGGAGAISLTNSTITTGGGDITLGGFGASGAAVAHGVAGDSTADAVRINSSTLDAGPFIPSSGDPFGALTITGQSSVPAGAGVRIGGGNVNLTAGNLTITGVSTGLGTNPSDPSSAGPGVAITAGSFLSSEEFSITGTSTYGDGLAIVTLSYAEPISLTQRSFPNVGGGGDSGIFLNGISHSDGHGVVIDNLSASSGALIQTDGTGVSISGSNASTTVDAVSIQSNSSALFYDIVTGSDAGADIDISASGGGQLLSYVRSNSFNNFRASSSSSLVVANSNLSTGGGAGGSGGTINLYGKDVSISTSTINSSVDNVAPDITVSSSTNLTIGDSTLTSAVGMIDLLGKDVLLRGDTQVFLAFNPNLATVLLVAGPDGTGPAQSFENKSTFGNGTFVPQASSGGRWIIWLNDATDPSKLNLGGLDYGFQRYGAKSTAAWANDSGQGVVTYVDKAVTTNGDVASKTYDGTTTTTVTGLTVTPQVAGDTTVGFSPSPSYTANFSDKNAGANKVVTVNGFSPNSLQFVDSTGHSVLGYTFANGLRGVISRAVLHGNVIAFDKTYDGTTNATVNITNITGLVGSETVSSTGVGSFIDKNVGQDKPVNVTYSLGNGTNGGLGSNYQLLPSNLVTANITPASLNFAATGVSRPYDGTTSATAAISNITGLVGGESVTITGTGSFADKNVGQDKPFSASYTFSGSNGWLASNYRFRSSDLLSADITPATLTFMASGVSRVYDGTTNATVNITGIGGLVGGETVTVTGTGAFADKNIGQDKPINVSYALGSGANGWLASNYQFSTSGVAKANITPATLTYTAAPVNVFVGSTLPALNGSVSGFIGGETLATATTGSLSFMAGVGNTAVAGVYAINGQGLLATNYDFVQALGNAVALTIDAVDLNGPNGPLVQTQFSALPARDVGAAPTPRPDPKTSGLLDLTPKVQSGPPRNVGPASAANFDSVPIDTMSPLALADLLGARESLMESILKEALEALRKDPSLADVGACESLKEALLGTCLVTEAMKAKFTAARVKQATSSESSGQAATPPPPQAAGPVEALPELPPPLFGTARVKTAALPAIRRKVAVLIGEGRYTDSKIPGLANTVGDAHAVAATLTEQLGYETLVLDNPSKQELIGTLNRLALEIGPEDSAIVFYAGHGAVVEETGAGYWLASSSQAQDPKTWLSNADIARLIEQVGAKQVVLISDSCYSGTLVAGARIRGAPGELNPADVLSRRSTVVMSSGANEPVFDSGRNGHSLFAWSLMNTLSQVKTWRPGGNLFERIRFTVARELPQRPQYGAATGYQEGGDYLFEVRELDTQSSGGKAPG